MIIVIFGPTASNKSSVAIKLATLLDCPIINSDAFQIYKDMNIGTAKISKDDPMFDRHYLLDIKSPEETYSVKEYQSDFRKVLDELLKTNKNVIVCGGTGLYIKAALYDYEFVEEQETFDTSIYDDKSNEELYELLKSLDVKASENIHPNNRKRVIRALAILSSSNMRKSEIIEKQEHKLIYDDVRFYFINKDREKLYENINKRVDIMFDLGLVDEVKGLLNKYNLSQTAKAGIGYKEVIDYLNGEMSLDECKELIKKRTRNYAKRQVTFFKNQFVYKEVSDADLILKDFENE